MDPRKMNKYKLKFISDDLIFNHVKETVMKYRFEIDLSKFCENLLDPIKLTFDTKVYRHSMETVLHNEILRQIDKSNTNHIGYFNQNIFRYLSPDWTCPETGYDIINKKMKIFVEMKNKHNTMNSSSSQKTYMRMQNTLLHTPKAQCLLVEVIASNSQNIIWKMSLDGESFSDARIRRMSIDKFYELVTGDKLAFKNLCEALPKILDDVVASLKASTESNSVIQELKAIDKNLLKSVYLLSFKKYEGFNDFNI